MMTKLITVKEYLDNKNLLIVNDYIPYAKKVEIVNKILNSVINISKGVCKIDYVLLNRVKIQIYIEQLTNLSLANIDNDNDIDGYDLLVKYNELDNLLNVELKKEIKEFNIIMELKIKELENINANLQMYLDYKIGEISSIVNDFMPMLLTKIEGVNIESIVESFSTVLDVLGSNKSLFSNKLKEDDK